MKMLSIEQELKSNSYPGRGIILGKSEDGTKAVAAYFIMGRSENSRNRVFVEEGQGIRTQAFDPSKLTDPSLIIYAPVRVLGNKTIVTNGDQTDTIYEGMDKQMIFAAVGVVIGLVVPVVIRKLDRLKDWGYMYAGAGILALVLVAVLAEVSGGAKLGFTIAGFGIQPSEFVKILFVFFVAANLIHSLEFKNIVITTALAAAHVLILVLSTDLGTALILFVVYLVMLYTATRQPLYVAAGLGGGSVAAACDQ